MSQDFLSLLLCHKRARQISQDAQDVIKCNLPIAVSVINLENKFNLLLQACAGAERRQKRHKLLEVEPIQHPQEPLGEGIDRELGDGHELVGGDEAAAVAVELAEALVQGHDLLLRD